MGSGDCSEYSLLSTNIESVIFECGVFLLVNFFEFEVEQGVIDLLWGSGVSEYVDGGRTRVMDVVEA